MNTPDVEQSGMHLREWVDLVADQFEAAWRRGEPQSPAEFLTKSLEPGRRLLAIELVHLDLEWSFRQGTSRSLEYYAERIPDLLQADGTLPAEIVEHFRSLQAGPGTDRSTSSSTAREREAIGRPSLGTPTGASPAPPGIKGRRLGRFLLEEPLGSGAFATVYRALDVSLNRKVAVKIPRSSLLGEPEQRERFLREARSAAGLNHPGIVPIYEIATDGDITYLVSELVEGTTLQQQIAERRPSSHEAAQITAQLADALHFAHQSGVVHRDVKPSNVLLDSQGKARLTDFGLARVGPADSHFTQEGQIVGTPAYMSPEQAAAESGRIDARSDVYSLGVVLYELLTGKRPFEGSLQVVLDQVRRGEPRPPRKVNPRVPRDLETICLKATSKDPSRRYTSAHDMAADLKHFLQDEPIVARPPSLPERCLRFWRRHPLATSAVAAIIVLLVVGADYWWRTPGTLLLAVRPAGAHIEVAGQEFVAQDEPLPLRLQSGAYRVHVSAADYADQGHDAYVTRGQTKPLQVSLVHDEGSLEVFCEPRSAEIEVNDIAYGSRIRNLKRPTGSYSLKASCEGYVDSPLIQRVLQKDETFQFRFWLDRGLLWQYRSPHIQGGLILVPDVDGDGAPDLAHNELGRLIILSSANGKIVWEMPISHGEALGLEPNNLGGDIGEVILVGRETPHEKASPGGVHALAIRLGAKPKALWEWRGPSRDWKSTQGIRIFNVGDLTGDGVADLAIAGREPRIYLLSGKTGELLREAPLPGIERAGHTTLAWSERLPGTVLYTFQEHDPDAGPRPRQISASLGAMRLEPLKSAWTKHVDQMVEWRFKDIDGDRNPEILVFQDSCWDVFDSRTGEVRWHGAAPGHDSTKWYPGFTDLDGDSVMEVVLSPSPESSKPLTAARLRDGAVLWEGPIGGARLTVPDGQMLRTAAGDVLARAPEALVALDPRTGGEKWRHLGDALGVVMADWDGDGRNEIFVTVPQVGLSCLDGHGRLLWTVHITPEIQPLVTLPDIDGDGRPEVVVHRSSSQLGVVRGPRIRWSASASGPLQATPLVTDDFSGDGHPEIVTLGPWAIDRNLLCLDGATGAVRWAANVDVAPNSAPALADWDNDGHRDVVLVGQFRPSNEMKLAVIRGQDGTTLVSHAIPRQVAYSVPVTTDLDGDGTLDVALHRWEPQDVVAFSGRTGVLLWRFATQAGNFGGVAVADLDGDKKPDIVAPSLDGRLYALRGGDGHLLWSARLEDGSRAPPAIHDMNADGVPDVLVMSDAGRLHIHSGRDGAELWSTSVPGASRSVGRPQVTKVDGSDLVIAPFGRGGVAAFDFSQRKLVWSAAESAGVTASPRVVDLDEDGLREVIVATLDGRMLVLDLATGKTLWSVRISDKMIEADPAVFSCDSDGVLDIVVADHDFQLTVVGGFSAKHIRRTRAVP